MTSREEFDAWADKKGLYASDRWIYFEGWQARGELDAKRITELEAKLAIAIDAFEAIKECSGTSQRQWHLADEALTKIKGE